MEVLKQWFNKYFSNPQVVILILVILLFFIIVYYLGGVLSPVLTSIVIAYMLQGPVRAFERIGIPRSLSFGFVYLIFLAMMLLVLLWILPNLYVQTISFFQPAPTTASSQQSVSPVGKSAEPDAKPMVKPGAAANDNKPAATVDAKPDGKTGDKPGAGADAKSGPGQPAVATMKPVEPKKKTVADKDKPTLGGSLTKSNQDLVRFITGLSKKYPNIIPESAAESTAKQILTKIEKEIVDLAQSFVSLIRKPSTWRAFISTIVFIVLVPLLVFFFLKDRDKIIAWFASFFPKDIQLPNTVWRDLNRQIGNYIRGKILEVLLVTVACYIVFSYFDLKPPLLLALMVGLSVIIPYIGAVVVTIPIVLVSYVAYGFSETFWWLMAWYAIIQTIDGVVVVPLLFAEVVKLHPIAIVVSVLVFGGLFGFWGVFFDIPLASLIQAILNAWPRPDDKVEPPQTA